MSSETFLWHDYETFGTDPRRDRPCQFAALRTGTDLEPIEPPVVAYCRPTSDLLPVPEACLVTGITPQYARDHGLPEPEFARLVWQAMSRPGTCNAGYNNFRFDDEITRHLFWRNFFDPYAREYANGNSRFDLIDVLRLTRALRPEGIEWPAREDGTPSFRLEDLARANGLDVTRAHDALADVENTVAMARLVATRQPRLWHWALSLRAKHRVAGLLEKRAPLLHASARLPAADYCLAPVLPLFPHSQIASQWLVWNLRVEPDGFFDLDPEILEETHFNRAEDLPEGLERLPVKWVRTNRCPMLAPLGTLTAEARARLGLEMDRIEARARRIAGQSEFLARLASVFDRPRPAEPADPEVDLYSGFVPPADRRIAAGIPDLDGEALARLDAPFQDARLNTLLVRYRARHYPETLSPEEKQAWSEYRRRRLAGDPQLATIGLDEYKARVAGLFESRPEHRDLLEALADWPREIGTLDPGEN